MVLQHVSGAHRPLRVSRDLGPELALDLEIRVLHGDALAERVGVYDPWPIIPRFPARGEYGVEALISGKEIVRDLDAHVEVDLRTGGERERLRDFPVRRDRRRGAAVGGPLGGCAVARTRSDAGPDDHRVILQT